ncbi:hypothetical protein GCM10027612_65200 [Microbispora bryophytorum subsp. camponoti]
MQTRALHAYLRWRNANARHRDVLAAGRRRAGRHGSIQGGQRVGGAQVAAVAGDFGEHVDQDVPHVRQLPGRQISTGQAAGYCSGAAAASTASARAMAAR